MQQDWPDKIADIERLHGLYGHLHDMKRQQEAHSINIMPFHLVSRGATGESPRPHTSSSSSYQFMSALSWRCPCGLASVHVLLARIGNERQTQASTLILPFDQIVRILFCFLHTIPFTFCFHSCFLHHMFNLFVFSNIQ